METIHIINKIKKLLELQKSAESIGSLEEAANAALKVQAILLKYNLEIADVESQQTKRKSAIEKVSMPNIKTKKNESEWIINLYEIVASYNFGFVVTTTRIDNRTGCKYKFINLVGTKDNIDVIIFICSQLEYQIRNLEGKSWAEHNDGIRKRNSYRRGYFDGAVVGIHHKLEEAQAIAMSKNNQVTALVIDHNKRIKEELPNLFQNLKFTDKASREKKDYVATLNGYRDGKNINIHQGLSGDKNQPQLK